jgi:hypothetical protein
MDDEVRGPVDVLVLAFPGSRFDGGLLPAVERLADGDAVRIVDLAAVRKDESGTVAWFEVQELDDAFRGEVIELVREASGLRDDVDLDAIGEALRPGDAAAVLILEHLWARELATSIAGSEGVVTFHERIPLDLIRPG